MKKLVRETLNEDYQSDKAKWDDYELESSKAALESQMEDAYEDDRLYASLAKEYMEIQKELQRRRERLRPNFNQGKAY